MPLADRWICLGIIRKQYGGDHAHAQQKQKKIDRRRKAKILLQTSPGHRKEIKRVTASPDHEIKRMVELIANI